MRSRGAGQVAAVVPSVAASRMTSAWARFPNLTIGMCRRVSRDDVQLRPRPYLRLGAGPPAHQLPSPPAGFFGRRDEGPVESDDISELGEHLGRGHEGCK